MQLLLDTHAFLWWFAGDLQLSSQAQRVIGDESSHVLISAATAWEIATKFRIGKLPEAAELSLDMPGYMAAQDFEAMDVTLDHAIRAGSLPGPIRDPFDRMLIAQALTDDLVLVSNETLFDQYGVRRLW